MALRVPHFEDDKLDASLLILADQIESVPTTQIGTGQFVLNFYKVNSFPLCAARDNHWSYQS